MKDYMVQPRELKGHFTLLTIDKDGNILDTYEDPNMIMESARNVMADNIGFLADRKSIDKIVLGTKGHVDGDILTPKGPNEGFVSTRTELFAEESDDFIYPITFTSPGTTSDDCVDVVDPDDGDTTVSFLQSSHEITYTVDLANNSGNNGDSVIYTEAALYAGPDIFSMKTFKAKIKDSSVLIRIIWKISF